MERYSIASMETLQKQLQQMPKLQKERYQEHHPLCTQET